MAQVQISTNQVRATSGVGRLKTLAQGLATMAVWVLVLFLAAGRINWARGWACAAVYVVSMLITGRVVHRRNPGLLEARSKWRQKGMPLFDRIFVSAYMPLLFGQVIVAGLDAGRYGWLALGDWTFVLGTGLFLAAMAVVTWVFVTNPFAETVVRIQSERGHRVISGGPYRVIRHPMYAASMVMYPATGLMFGSGWAIAVSALIDGMIVWRTAREDEYLRKHLDGYAEFAGHVRYRLVPGIW